MSKEILLQHHALITHKASSLSSAQRQAVQLRVAYGLENGQYTHDEVNGFISDLGVSVAEEITNRFNEYTDADSSQEHE